MSFDRADFVFEKRCLLAATIFDAFSLLLFLNIIHRF